MGLRVPDLVPPFFSPVAKDASGVLRESANFLHSSILSAHPPGAPITPSRFPKASRGTSPMAPPAHRSRRNLNSSPAYRAIRVPIGPLTAQKTELV